MHPADTRRPICGSIASTAAWIRKEVLKVGPALTYGLREALFSLSMMEKELVPEEKRANFIETLDSVMLASPANWEKHYHGDEKHLAQCRKQ